MDRISNLRGNGGYAAVVLTACTLVYTGSATAQGVESMANLSSSSEVVVCLTLQETELIVDPKTAIWSKFQDLAVQWRSERGVRSSITEISVLPSYQKIIGMGPDVVPLILQQLEMEGAKPDQWFWALRVITDQDPVSEAERGNFVSMARAWIAWGQKEGYGWYVAAA